MPVLAIDVDEGVPPGGGYGARRSAAGNGGAFAGRIETQPSSCLSSVTSWPATALPSP